MEEKCLEFYFNENEYNEEKEQELIRQIKKEERVKEVRLEVNRNEWGIYIVKANIYQRKIGTFIYENKKDKLIQKQEKGKIEEVIYTKPELLKKEKVDNIDISNKKNIINQSTQSKKKTKKAQTKYEKYTNRTYGKYESKGEFKPL